LASGFERVELFGGLDGSSYGVDLLPTSHIEAESGVSQITGRRRDYTIRSVHLWLQFAEVRFGERDVFRRGDNQIGRGAGARGNQRHAQRDHPDHVLSRR